MNLIQIANGMGTNMTFGDLPQYSMIIEKVNEILPEAQAITVTTTGSDFLAIYSTLKQSQQNQLARVIENNTELRLEIVTDIAFHEISERRREKQTFQNNVRVYLLIVAVIVLGNLFNAYTYHQAAVKVIGQDYNSSMLGVVKEAFQWYDKLLTTKDPEPK